jgi:small subunit ribosomal protein S11
MAKAPVNTAARRVSKKVRKNVADGIAHVHASFNNTIITITDRQGGALSWASSGGQGFKGSRKSTPFAAQVAAEECRPRRAGAGHQEPRRAHQGPGPGTRVERARAGLAGHPHQLDLDVTPIPHNGCRPQKRRRI